ncbi:NAD(P)H-dependent glycerol-3-phosphate dehydrogenase [Arthrobacter sp. NPDC090010]|uniref:NAD(P)H-dependent glycerol-3-phosphate dehydrogenase n=1 Tax=Arthrobacter sp. NPDC090010 TaxID=3363942 RepID=UPI0038296814
MSPVDSLPRSQTSLKIAVMGSGSWGTTFAKVLGDAAGTSEEQRDVVLWARRSEVAEEINREHRNHRYLQDTVLPGAVRATDRVEDALSDADVVVLAVPAQSLREQLRVWKDFVSPTALVVSLMKGLERGTDERMSQVIAQEWEADEDRILVLSGPNLALEIAREEPTASVVACSDEQAAHYVAELCTAPYFRPYTSSDVVGVEIGGIVKNVIALAVGICEGRAMGDNTKASVITRGLAETTRLAIALGGEAHTLAGLAGLGDLVATCASSLSRNHTAGKLLGQGLTLPEVVERMTQTAEGVKSAEAVQELAARNGVEMPITAAVVAVLDGRLAVDELGPLLLNRSLKSEDGY